MTFAPTRSTLFGMDLIAHIHAEYAKAAAGTLPPEIEAERIRKELTRG